MKKPASFTIAAALACWLGVIYLGFDLLILDGPLRRWIQRACIDEANPNPAATPAAQLCGRTILMRELDQSVVIRRLRSGKSLDIAKLDADSLFKLRAAALESMLDDIALDEKLLPGQPHYDGAAVDLALADEETRWGGADSLQSALSAAGISRTILREQLRAQLGRVAYLEARIESAGANHVDEIRIKDWFDSLPETPTVPARLKVRHIFKAALHQDPEALKAKIHAVHAMLVADPSQFAPLASSESDDLATSSKGGELGWLEGPDPRWPDGLDFEALSNAPRGKILAPVQSRLGWHIFVVDAMEPSRPMDPVRDAAEIRACLISKQRRQVTRDILRLIRSEGGTVINQEAMRMTPWTL